ncbi:hypothetical protein TKWG_11370 [Advenella kashmirensis WT001]|uniref:Uncharacterized protein n=1 Tax=Advenella kashmirensis (strain DSM 17095 / LMG 22695 / WT001) TaxID=1036672 RepID=I3UBU6_ADVKW|nr:hypothetical protein [Advenella kashmirensis]AFK62484.1 hypothetical protein TKWG_11370 [Advenella kashmirensis WT001]
MTAFIDVRINPTGSLVAINLAIANRMLLKIRMIFTILLQQNFSYEINQFFLKFCQKNEKKRQLLFWQPGFPSHACSAGTTGQDPLRDTAGQKSVG